MENHKNKASLRKIRFWIRASVTRREGFSTLLRPPEGSTFNYKCKVDVIFKILIFPKNNKTKMLKEAKYFFNFLGPTRIDLGPTYSHSK